MTTGKTKTVKKPGLIERTHARITEINQKADAQIKRRRVAYQNEVNAIRTRAQAAKDKLYAEVEASTHERSKPKR